MEAGPEASLYDAPSYGSSLFQSSMRMDIRRRRLRWPLSEDSHKMYIRRRPGPHGPAASREMGHSHKSENEPPNAHAWCLYMMTCEYRHARCAIDYMRNPAPRSPLGTHNSRTEIKNISGEGDKYESESKSREGACRPLDFPWAL